ncbi:Transposable element tcb2 transposase [Caligus rogercresseyi]|uniref:Transposable element tcb2 transposase n=1 Tax=Caligus rogercresseyi TaxID=217165 RepID=A0A7T8KCC8_CALRO|nr:Transposable element tcb2 transposase [Caligus rogercresseyi]
MTKLAAGRDVSIYTISKAVREDLGYKSFTLRVIHLLTEKQKDARVARGKDMLNFIKSSSSPSLRFFSDEKLFNLDRTHNRQNTRWICKDPEDVSMVFKYKNPASVMVLGVISSDGDINQEVYLEVLRDVVVPWMYKVAKGRRYTFQQHSAPGHKAKRVQAWVLGAVPHFWKSQE